MSKFLIVNNEHFHRPIHRTRLDEQNHDSNWYIFFILALEVPILKTNTQNKVKDDEWYKTIQRKVKLLIVPKLSQHVNKLNNSSKKKIILIVKQEYNTNTVTLKNY